MNFNDIMVISLVELSVIIPVMNEEENVEPLHTELSEVLNTMKISYEIIYIDDGSTDKTVEILKTLQNIVIIQLNKNFGQSAAMKAGFDHANGKYIVSMDGDLQNDPKSIVLMYEEIKKGNVDVICGWRYKRKDRLLKKLFSKLANILRRRLLDTRIHDSGCSLRIYSKQAIDSIPLQGEMHRYIPALLNTSGYRIGEIKVNHRRRMHGKTKYGWRRLIRGFVDLILISFWNRFSTRPLHFFGPIGLFLTFIGMVLSGYLVVERLLLITTLTDRPLFLLALIIMILGIQIFTLGFIAEYLSKISYQSSEFSPYVIKQVIRTEDN